METGGGASTEDSARDVGAGMAYRADVTVLPLVFYFEARRSMLFDETKKLLISKLRNKSSVIFILTKSDDCSFSISSQLYVRLGGVLCIFQSSLHSMNGKCYKKDARLVVYYLLMDRNEVVYLSIL